MTTPYFFEDLARFGDAPALTDSNETVSYTELTERCETLQNTLPQVRQFVFIRCNLTIATVVNYLACLRAGHCAMLVSADSSESQFAQLKDAFKPHLTLDDKLVCTHHTDDMVLESRAALMLSTSGSTGAAKHVVLSADNLHSNAYAINQYLPIKGDDVTLANLPLNYAYGLSVLNSHLLSGATTYLTGLSPVQQPFWQLLEDKRICSIAGVPHSYEMLVRLGLTKRPLPNLRYFTQAGGKLAPRFVSALADYAAKYGKQFFIMYGQTEATARMAFLPPANVSDKPESIGRAIPGGEFRLLNDNGAEIPEHGCAGELCYKGDNVMLGYASSVEELAQLETQTWLHTGDIATRDAEGDYFIVGRKKRFIKLWGQRISLDAVEQLLSQKGINAYCCGSDKALMVITTHIDEKEVIAYLTEQLRLHPSVIRTHILNELPVTASGKKDYIKAQQLAEPTDNV